MGIATGLIVLGALVVAPAARGARGGRDRARGTPAVTRAVAGRARPPGSTAMAVNVSPGSPRPLGQVPVMSAVAGPLVSADRRARP